MDKHEIEQLARRMAEKAREAALALATVSRERKDRAMETIATLLARRQDAILRENRKDLDAGREAGLSAAMLDRLMIDSKRLAGIAESVRQVASLDDPVGEEIERTRRPNGLEIRKVRAPMGVIGIIYESRPNVTVDCAVLCLKSGNASLLRGGKEAFHTNTALAAIITEALLQTGLPAAAVQLIPTTDRSALSAMLKLDTLIQCIIPRGGEDLIRFVTENSRIPVIKHYKGVCSLYIDRGADLKMAESIAINAKCQRPGVCNAIEKLLVHKEIAPVFIPIIARALHARSVELRVDEATAAILRESGNGVPFKPAIESDWTEEYLAPIIAIKIVPSAAAAIADINRHGSGHSDAIVTSSEPTAREFLNEVDSAAVYWNASTRFTDGFEFGMGAEIGISTDKLHARGPMGLRELCTYKFIVTGDGQIRE